MTTNLRRGGLGLLVLLSCAGGFAACSASDMAGGGEDGASSGDSNGGDGGLDGGWDGAGIDGGAAGSGNGPQLPEETEDETSFRAPVATGKYLWSANPDSGRVALIDSELLSVRVLSAGLFPTHLAEIPSSGGVLSAIVLNVGSSDASWFRLRNDELEEKRLPTHAGANRWGVSRAGAWAVAYSVQEPGDALDPTEGLQEISLLRLDPAAPRTTRFTVGYRPRQFVFAEDESRLVVVSQDGITLLSLEDDDPRLVDFIGEGVGQGQDVSITSDGKYALVRVAGSPLVTILSLDDPEDRRTIELDGPLTDLDLDPSGRVVAIVRDRKQLVTFTFPEILDAPDEWDVVEFPDELFGSAALAPGARRAVLYTNAVPHSRATIVELEPGATYLSGRSLDVRAPITNVAVGPDGLHAVLLSESTNPVATSFSVLPLGEVRFPRIVGTTARVAQVALTEGAAVITTRGQEAYWVSLPSLALTKTALASPPLAAGALADQGLGWVAQSHPEGRVTFFDWRNNGVRTLTGYELSAKVVDR